MDLALPESDQIFLRDLVKASRQRPHSVSWKDRDGTDRVTTLTQSEVVMLNRIAAKLRISKSEMLRQGAHLPVAKPAPVAPEAASEPIPGA
jgi:hypothetical protein